MILKSPHLLTKLEIWFLRYSSAYTDTNERVALLADYKLHKATPIVLVEFTKAKHLKGQRFAISRQRALECPLDTNGKIACRAVPMSLFEHWETVNEIKEIVNNIFEE